MRNDLLRNTDEDVVAVFKLLDGMTKSLESAGISNRQVFKGELFLTDRELSERLKISRRTLQEYRSAGKIPYHLVCGKVLYKESEIEKILADGYRQPFHNGL